MTIRRVLAGQAAPAAALPGTLVWTFGTSFSASSSTPDEEDVNLYDGQTGIRSRTNSWSGGAITTTCGFNAQPGLWTFGNVGVPELEGHAWWDNATYTVEIYAPSAQAGSGWRLYIGWGSPVALTNMQVEWRDGVSGSANPFNLIGNYVDMPIGSYGHIDDARFVGAAAWKAAYDDHYFPVTLTDQGGNTGVTFRINDAGRRMNWNCCRIRRYT